MRTISISRFFPLECQTVTETTTCIDAVFVVIYFTAINIQYSAVA